MIIIITSNNFVYYYYVVIEWYLICTYKQLQLNIYNYVVTGYRKDVFS